MKKYIGFKLIEAKSGTMAEAQALKSGMPVEQAKRMFRNSGTVDRDGYIVKYPDGYISWSPKDVFENAYLKVDDNKDLPSGVSIGQQMVNDFICFTETTILGNRTTVVRCVLRNGFEIVESSSCVDPKNYSEDMGYNICMGKIKGKIWELLGFLLQTAWHGIK